MKICRLTGSELFLFLLLSRLRDMNLIFVTLQPTIIVTRDLARRELRVVLDETTYKNRVW